MQTAAPKQHNTYCACTVLQSTFIFRPPKGKGQEENERVREEMERVKAREEVCGMGLHYLGYLFESDMNPTQEHNAEHSTKCPLDGLEIDAFLFIIEQWLQKVTVVAAAGTGAVGGQDQDQKLERGCCGPKQGRPERIEDRTDQDDLCWHCKAFER